MGRNRVAVIGVQRLEQRRREAPRRAEARPGGNVGHAGDLKVGFPDIEHFQGFTNNRMLNFIDGGHSLHFGVLDDQFLLERLVDRDVHVAVNGSGDQHAAVFAVIGRQIGAAAAE